MQGRATLLVIGVLLAGCATPSDRANAPTDGPLDVPEVSPSFSFESARQVATVDNTQHEAFLAVSPDGRVLLTCAHGNFKEPANLFASTDGGATFRELDPGQPMLPAGDCEVALAADGTWTFAGKTDLGIAVASTSDEGATWRVNHLAGPPLNGLADRQWLAYVGDTLLMTYQPGTQQAGPVLLTRSTDHGLTWSQPTEVAAVDPLHPVISAGDFAVSPDGTTAAFVVAREVPTTTLQVELLTTHDAGATWDRQAIPVTSLDAYPSVPAITTTGVLVWPYRDLDALLAITSSDGGTTWTPPIHLADGIDWPRVWSAARPDGLVDIVWMSTGAHFGRAEGLALTRFDPATNGAVHQAIVADIGFLEYAAVASDGAGRAHAVVMDAPSRTDGDLSTDLDGGLLYVRELLT